MKKCITLRLKSKAAANFEGVSGYFFSHGSIVRFVIKHQQALSLLPFLTLHHCVYLSFSVIVSLLSFYCWFGLICHTFADVWNEPLCPSLCLISASSRTVSFINSTCPEQLTIFWLMIISESRLAFVCLDMWVWLPTSVLYCLSQVFRCSIRSFLEIWQKEEWSRWPFLNFRCSFHAFVYAFHICVCVWVDCSIASVCAHLCVSKCDWQMCVTLFMGLHVLVTSVHVEIAPLHHFVLISLFPRVWLCQPCMTGWDWANNIQL